MPAHRSAVLVQTIIGVTACRRGCGVTRKKTGAGFLPAVRNIFCYTSLMVVGVLAFQGDFAEHIAVLHSLHVPALEVRSLEDLAKVDALILPGGESTVISKFLEESGVGKEIRRRALTPLPPLPARTERVRSGGPRGEGEKGKLILYGTCAGAILLSKKGTGKNCPRTLGLIDVTIDRNAYGSQAESFEAKLSVKGLKDKIDTAFIRAPKITKIGREVEVLSSHEGVPVLVRQGNILIGTFHPEVRGNTKIHELFLKMTTE